MQQRKQSRTTANCVHTATKPTTPPQERTFTNHSSIEHAHSDLLLETVKAQRTIIAQLEARITALETQFKTATLADSKSSPLTCGPGMDAGGSKKKCDLLTDAAIRTSAPETAHRAEVPKQKGKRKKARRRAGKLAAAIPLEFTKLWIRLNNGMYKRLRQDGLRANEAVKEMLHGIGVKNWVVLSSKIGNSILELYVPTNKMTRVRSRLGRLGITMETQMDVSTQPPFGDRKDNTTAMIERLAFLYSRTALVNLRGTILSGVPAHYHTHIKDRADLLSAHLNTNRNCTEPLQDTASCGSLDV